MAERDPRPGMEDGGGKALRVGRFGLLVWLTVTGLTRGGRADGGGESEAGEAEISRDLLRRDLSVLPGVRLMVSV